MGEKLFENWTIEGDKLFEALNKYADKFGSFPTIPLLRIHGDEWVINVIDECLAKNKSVIQLGYFKMPERGVHID